MRKTKILIVDDHHIFREGLRSLIKSNDNLEVIGEKDNGTTAWSFIKQKVPDIVILDIAMGEVSGLDVARKIKSRGLTTSIIFLSMHNDVKIIDKAISSGADAYLMKDEAFDILQKAIDWVTKVKNKVYLSPQLKCELSEYQKFRTSFELTKRELEILCFIAKGLTNKHIAKMLLLSVKTIDNHRSNLMKKLGMHNTAELVRYAIKEGFVI